MPNVKVSWQEVVLFVTEIDVDDLAPKLAEEDYPLTPEGAREYFQDDLNRIAEFDRGDGTNVWEEGNADREITDVEGDGDVTRPCGHHWENTCECVPETN